MQAINASSQLREARPWDSTFSGAIPPSQTLVEIEFLRVHLPRRHFRDVLDLGCGTGRHSRFLSSFGYDVLGIDSDAAAIQSAKQFSHSGARYMRYDMRDLDSFDERFDAVISLSKSFGFYDDTTNANVLESIWRRLRPYGRVVIDVYNRDFFAAAHEQDSMQSPVIPRIENNRISTTQQTATLDAIRHTWRVYTRDEFCTLAEQSGYAVVAACTRFNAALAPDAGSPHMQFVLQAR